MAAPPETSTRGLQSVSGVQAAIRTAFESRAPEAALRAALGAIGRHFDAVYVAVQVELAGVQRSSDWSWEGFAAIDDLRESLGSTIVQVISAETARVVPVAGPGSPAILACPIRDGDRGIKGAACAVVGPCDSGSAVALLVTFEGLIGFLAVLMGRARGRAKLALPDHVDGRTTDPLFLAYAMAAELRNRRDYDQVAIGFAHRGRVRVAAVCGVDEVRQSNPGVKRIAAAMEECLDLGAPIQQGPDDAEGRYHLHVQWARSAGGGTVASVPIRRDDEVIGVASVVSRERIDAAQLAELDSDLQPLAWLLPVSRLASRGLWSHATQGIASRLERVFGSSWRSRFAAVAMLLLAAFVGFGVLPYSFTVPCTVVASQPRGIASPREGILRELFVRPGDRVVAGQILARLDTEDARLEAATYRADIRRFEAEVSLARAEERLGEAKVHLAEQAAAAARLARVELLLRRSEIRAPHDGLILSGDLTRRLGAKLALGDPLFEIAPSDAVQVELRIAERFVWEAREYEVVAFAPSARPTERIVLDGLQIPPSSTPIDGNNVFVARSTAFTPPRHLTPGMEGVAHVSVGERPVWWILTHRITDWLRLRFWL